MSAAATLQPPGNGFVADPGTNFNVGQEPTITADLARLGRALGVTIYGISGYRTPAHSVAVGGYANDPHTKGQAADIGVNAPTRASAAQISEAELAKFGLWRPFDPTDNPANSEVNHVQLLPGTARSTGSVGAGGGPLQSATILGGNLATGLASGLSGALGAAGTPITPPGGTGGATSAVSGLFSGFFNWLKSNLLRGVLFATLIGAGIALAIYGLARTFGRRQEPGQEAGESDA